MGTEIFSFIKELQTLVNRLSLFDFELAGLKARYCLLRIYRNIRFSFLTIPYKTYFAAYLALNGRKSERVGYQSIVFSKLIYDF